MRVLVTGATGFTGTYVVRRLLEQGSSVRCFVRRSSDTSGLPVDRIELTHGDLADTPSLVRAMNGVDVLVNLASLGFGHVAMIVAAAKEAGVGRAMFLSTTAVFTTLAVPSRSVRLAAEATIRDGGVLYTILRPTMIYGSARDRNMCRLIRYLNSRPVILVAGSGEFLQQPVYVEDVANAIVQSLGTSRTINKSYNIAGQLPLTYNEVIDRTCEALGRCVRKIHLPVSPIVAVLSGAERLSIPTPIKAEQVRRLNEDKVFDCSDALRDFDYRPRSFSDGIRLEVAQMGLGATR